MPPHDPPNSQPRLRRPDSDRSRRRVRPTALPLRRTAPCRIPHQVPASREDPPDKNRCGARSPARSVCFLRCPVGSCGKCATENRRCRHSARRPQNGKLLSPSDTFARTPHTPNRLLAAASDSGRKDTAKSQRLRPRVRAFFEFLFLLIIRTDCTAQQCKGLPHTRLGVT